MLTRFECKDWESVKAPFWKIFPSNSKQKWTRVEQVEDDTKLWIEKIVVSPEFFESYYELDYKSMPQEIWAILSQWEHEFLRSKFPEKLWTELTSEDLWLHQLEWARIVKNVSKWKLSAEQVKLLQWLTPHMLANFAEIEGENIKTFSWLIRLGGWSKKTLEKQNDLAA